MAISVLAPGPGTAEFTLGAGQVASRRVPQAPPTHLGPAVVARRSTGTRRNVRANHKEFAAGNWVLGGQALSRGVGHFPAGLGAG